MNLLSAMLWGCAAVGLGALCLQLWALRRHLGEPLKTAASKPGVSILKPLCGVDEGLEVSLELFATLPYPNYELLLGVRDVSDAAYPLAVALARRHPKKVRLVLQQGRGGLNPKVNQLISLEKAARHDVLVVSDSNTRVPAQYLHELAGWFADPTIVCVSNPVSGAGHRSFGALLDNLHLASSVGAGQVGAKRVAKQNLVVGKSMALRRSALSALGGFAQFSNCLAEDYVIGQALRRHEGWRVEIASTPVLNFATERSVRSFWERYARWGVIHRTAVSLPTSLAQALLNPWPLTLLALAAAPSRWAALACLGVLSFKAAIDCAAARSLQCDLPPSAIAAVAVRDVLIFVAWARGFIVRHVNWRGTLLRVGPHSRLFEEPPLALPAEPRTAEVTP